MTDKVQVAVRVRPLLPNEACRELSLTQINARQICIGDRRLFTVDNVLGFSTSNEQLYDQSVKPLLSSFFGGYNATVLAYGQTGTGKTYSIEGILPMIVRDIFSHFGNSIIGDSLSFGVVEVYGEELFDLLSQSRTPKSLILHDGGEQGVQLLGTTRATAKNLDEALLVLDIGKRMRITAATAMNDTSSRSHVIFSVHNSANHAKLHVVDLAGSERNKRTQNVGTRFKESVGINTGLWALGRVIHALSQGSKHVPYRNSKLTRLLQDSLGGNSRTLFLACVAPNKANVDETTRTLQYSCKAMNIYNEAIPAVDLLAAKQQKEMEELQHTHNLSCEEALNGNDEFLAEQAAEIKRLSDTVKSLQVQLNTANVDLKKDEKIFARNLKDMKALSTENEQLRKRVHCLENVVKTYNSPDQKRAVAAPPGTSPEGGYTASDNVISPSPAQAIQDQCDQLAKELESADAVLPFASTPRRRQETMKQSSTPPEYEGKKLYVDPAAFPRECKQCVQSAQKLQHVLSDALFYQQKYSTLKQQLRDVVSENDDLRQHNDVLQKELENIHALLQAQEF